MSVRIHPSIASGLTPGDSKLAGGAVNEAVDLMHAGASIRTVVEL